jgi:hypothetical protein
MVGLTADFTEREENWFQIAQMKFCTKTKNFEKDN